MHKPTSKDRPRLRDASSKDAGSAKPPPPETAKSGLPREVVLHHEGLVAPVRRDDGDRDESDDGDDAVAMTVADPGDAPPLVFASI